MGNTYADETTSLLLAAFTLCMDVILLAQKLVSYDLDQRREKAFF